MNAAVGHFNIYQMGARLIKSNVDTGAKGFGKLIAGLSPRRVVINAKGNFVQRKTSLIKQTELSDKGIVRSFITDFGVGIVSGINRHIIVKHHQTL